MGSELEVRTERCGVILCKTSSSQPVIESTWGVLLKVASQQARKQASKHAACTEVGETFSPKVLRIQF